MQVGNNIWIDTWHNARPIPVSAQSRLFNEAKEAHAILQFFKELTVRDLIDLIKPVAFCNAGHILVLKG
jgi:Rab3 GTPase-activating protein catalytic subunit